ncbi:hypothetical protein [Corallococcus exercitus]|uniref:Uncharacterized protein n=1 Tax=Corallococcus exercitus TaxID=2316736 RepID=A0A7Y4NCN8_9BACT|nr:hypothetical protein [Corallococcus exercitus]NOK08576.1 hypothetical protein [Corallococcus exercitus]
MRLSVALALLLCVAAPSALAEERASRARVSANGLYSVRTVDVGVGKCRLEMLKENGPLWSADVCVGTVDDLYFASNDGEKVWVLYPLVEKGKPPPGKKKTKGSNLAWARVMVAAQFDRTGQKLQERRLTELMTTKQLSEVRQMAHHLKWLEGTLGIPGKGPRLTDAGVLEFEPVGVKTQRLTF